MRVLIFFFLLAFASMTSAQTGHTVIVVDGDDCRILEGQNEKMDRHVPQGWTIINLTEEQCVKAINQLKEKDELGGNVLSYLELVKCEKPSGLASMSYLGVGAEEICEAAGYDYDADIFLVQGTGVEEVKAKKRIPLIIPIVLLLILVFLILIINKKRNRGF